jgi:hypothetical protein
LRTHALLNIYNDRIFLGSCLESLIDVVDDIIVADGAYRAYFDHYKQFDFEAQPWSTDGTLEIIKAFRGIPEVKWINPPRLVPTDDRSPDLWDITVWENQAVKRTALIDAVPVGDWFIIVDADEMLAGDAQEGLEEIMDSGCIAGNTPIYNPGLHVDRVIPQWHPRTFKKAEGMHYKGTHWHLRDKFDRIIEAKYPLHFTDRFAIAHFKGFKNQSRLIPHENYMMDLAERGWLEPKELEMRANDEV